MFGFSPHSHSDCRLGSGARRLCFGFGIFAPASPCRAFVEGFEEAVASCKISGLGSWCMPYFSPSPFRVLFLFEAFAHIHTHTLDTMCHRSQVSSKNQPAKSVTHFTLEVLLQGSQDMQLHMQVQGTGQVPLPIHNRSFVAHCRL